MSEFFDVLDHAPDWVFAALIIIIYSGLAVALTLLDEWERRR